MPSAPADRRLLAGRPPRWAAGLVVAVVALVAVAVLVALLRGPEEAVVPPPSSPGASTTSRDDGDSGADTRGDAAAALLEKLVSGLEGGGDLSSLAAPGDASARAELRTLRGNVRALRITDLSMRYVDERQGGLADAQEQKYGERAWVGDVQVDWRLAGFDTSSAHLEVPITFVETPDGAGFLSSRPESAGSSSEGSGADGATPLWLLDRVAVRRAGRAVVLAAGRTPDLARFARLADQAVVDVREVLPAWRGRLVVEVPGDEQELGRVLGASPSQYGGIAAVTTTVDGSDSPTAPVHIFVNPKVFDPLGPRGSQIVMSHEATHVATDAAVSTMPTWLLEGFADFVALDHVDLPVSVTASQVLARVRKDGPPGHLPGKAEFDPQNQALGTSYEAAWLACRLLGETYGEARLIRFYRQSDRDGSTDAAFRDVLGTDQQAFTRAWKGYLRKLAG